MATVLVIVVHTAADTVLSYPTKNHMAWCLLTLVDTLAHVCVPLFVMITGAIYLRRSIDNPARFYARRLPKIAWLLAIWTSIYELFNTGAFNSLENVPKLIAHHAGSYHLWYLYILFGLYLTIPFASVFYKAATKNMRLALLAVWLGISVILAINNIAGGQIIAITFMFHDDAITYIGYAIAGAFILDHMRQGSASIWVACYIGVAALASSAIWALSVMHNSIYLSPLNYWCPTTLMMSVCAFVSLLRIFPICPRPVRFPVALVGRYSLGIYLGHLIPLNYIKTHFSSAIASAPLISSLLTCMTVLSVSFVATYLIRQTPFSYILLCEQPTHAATRS